MYEGIFNNTNTLVDLSWTEKSFHFHLVWAPSSGTSVFLHGKNGILKHEYAVGV